MEQGVDPHGGQFQRWGGRTIGDDVGTIAREHTIVDVIEMLRRAFARSYGGHVSVLDSHQLSALGNMRVTYDAVATHFAVDCRRRGVELVCDDTLTLPT